MTTNVIIVALVLLAIILCGVTIPLYRKIERVEAASNGLRSICTFVPTAIQQCAETMKRMGEVIGKMGVKLPIDKEG